MTREFLSLLIKGAQALKFTASYNSAEAALKGLPLEKPDVVLMDINLPGKSGVECVRELKGVLPDTKIVMLTSDGRDDVIFESLKAGANGYLKKGASPAQIIQAILEVREGGSPMSSQIAVKVVEFFHSRGKNLIEPARLTVREREILDLLSKGLLYKEIADSLGISFQTVNGHIKNIYEKLQVNSRSEAIAKYLA